MLSDNIRGLRKQKGMTQEELAVRLHVVRQTVSKWEKGLSVPDAAMLQRLADELDVTVSELLGAEEAREPADRNEIAEQLARLNGLLAVRNRRSRRIWTAAAVLLAVLVLVPILGSALFMTDGTRLTVSMTMSDMPVYTEAEVDEAIQAVRKSFRENFRGCTLEEVDYDEAFSQAQAAEWAARYGAEEAVVLTSRFTTDRRGGDGSLEPDHTYENWQWVLTRNAGGRWAVRTWGC